MTSRWFPEGPITVRPRTGWVFLFLTTLVTGPVLVSAFVPVRPTTAAVAAEKFVARRERMLSRKSPSTPPEKTPASSHHASSALLAPISA